MAFNSPVTCHVAMDNLLVALGCADGTLLILDCLLHKIDRQTKCGLAPSLIRQHPDKALLVVASERGFVQFFDVALNPIWLTLANDSLDSNMLLDTTHYFKPQMSLVDAKFCHRDNSSLTTKSNCPMSLMANNFLLLRFHVRE